MHEPFDANMAARQFGFKRAARRIAAAPQDVGESSAGSPQPAFSARSA
jgi:hypothetical protein